MSSEAATIPSGAVPARASQMAWQRVDGELVLLAIEGRELLGLNDVGAMVWELIDETHDVAAIIEAVAREFDVDAAIAGRDVERFLIDLLARGIVVLRPAP